MTSLASVSRARTWLLVCGSLLIHAIGCTPQETDIGFVGQLDYKGRVHRIETLGRYSWLDAALVYQLAGIQSKARAEHDYYLYRVVYSTRDPFGKETEVSGLVALPTTPELKGVVSWQHGTNTYRPNSISAPSMPEGIGVSGVFASDGYLLVAADYVGLGVSQEPHPYYHYPSTVGAVLDLLPIAETMLEAVAHPAHHDLYLAGFSQGGGATAAVQRAIEQDSPTGLTSSGLRLRAAVSISAAFDPANISLPYIFDTKYTSLFGYFATSFARIAGKPLSEVVREPFADLLPSWFDGTRAGPFLEKNLPASPRALATEEFATNLDRGIAEPSWFYDQLEACAVDDYAPQAPLRIFFGSTDDIVIPEEATEAFKRMREANGNVELVEMGPYNHETVSIAALPHVQQWFDSFASDPEK